MPRRRYCRSWNPSGRRPRAADRHVRLAPDLRHGHRRHRQSGRPGRCRPRRWADRGRGVTGRPRGSANRRRGGLGRLPGIHRRPLPLRVLATQGRRHRSPAAAGDHHRPAVTRRVRLHAGFAFPPAGAARLSGGIQRSTRRGLGVVGSRAVPGPVRRSIGHQRGAPGGLPGDPGRGGGMGPPPCHAGRDRAHAGTHPPGNGNGCLRDPGGPRLLPGRACRHGRVDRGGPGGGRARRGLLVTRTGDTGRRGRRGE